MSKPTPKAIPTLEHADYYRQTLLLGIPLLCMAVYYYGPRPLIVCAFAVVLGNLCDRLVSALRKRPYQPADFSNEAFGMVIALLMPASVDYHVVAVAVLTGVLVGKEAFGGYGSYPFHPAAVGYAIAAVCWPEQVFHYTTPGVQLPLGSCAGLASAQGVSSVLKNGGIPTTSWLNLLLGNHAGAIGMTALLVVCACGLALLVGRCLHPEVPLLFLATVFLFAFAFPRAGDFSLLTAQEGLHLRAQIAAYELCGGGVIFSAFFLLNEPFICPHNRMGRILFALIVGLLTSLFCYYGVYENGTCFALLSAGSVSVWLNGTAKRLNTQFKIKEADDDEASEG